MPDNALTLGWGIVLFHTFVFARQTSKLRTALQTANQCTCGAPQASATIADGNAALVSFKIFARTSCNVGQRTGGDQWSVFLAQSNECSGLQGCAGAVLVPSQSITDESDGSYTVSATVSVSGRWYAYASLPQEPEQPGVHLIGHFFVNNS